MRYQQRAVTQTAEPIAEVFTSPRYMLTETDLNDREEQLEPLEETPVEA